MISKSTIKKALAKAKKSIDAKRTVKNKPIFKKELWLKLENILSKHDKVSSPEQEYKLLTELVSAIDTEINGNS